MERRQYVAGSPLVERMLEDLERLMCTAPTLEEAEKYRQRLDEVRQYAQALVLEEDAAMAEHRAKMRVRADHSRDEINMDWAGVRHVDAD